MNGVELIAQERQRQIDVEGYSPEHDDEHTEGQLAGAAECYVARAADQAVDLILTTNTPVNWGFDNDMWKPSPDPIRNLVKAGALIAAEIDRLQRAKEK